MPDVESLWDRVKSLGVRVLEPLARQRQGGMGFMVADPDGLGLRFVGK